jgi:hypothetical protein
MSATVRNVVVENTIRLRIANSTCKTSRLWAHLDTASGGGGGGGGGAAPRSGGLDFSRIGGSNEMHPSIMIQRFSTFHRAMFRYILTGIPLA